MWCRSQSSPPEEGARDGGWTLVELLVSIALVGVLTSAISTAIIVTLRSERPTAERIAESADVLFLQTWIPTDLSSAIAVNDDPTLQPATSQVLPGTNVMTLTRQDLDAGPDATYLVAYRYEQIGPGEWGLVRYEIRHVGLPSEQVTRIGVAHSLAPPPPGWTPDQAPTHAVHPRSRNQVVLRPIGEDIEVTFASGRSFTTGGAGLSSQDALPMDYGGGMVDPSAPPSRCGGTITLVLDTSGSILQVGGDGYVKAAATSFVDAFTGTPSKLGIVTFNKTASMLHPATPGQYVSLLNPSADVATAKARIAGLTFSGTTNWEDGLYWAIRNPATGQLHSELPELVVFVTDGDPNRNRTTPLTSNDSRIDAVDVSRAAAVANEARGTGARVIGIFVGSSATSPASVDRMKQVVGSVAWDGTGPTNVGNAASADYFIPGGNGAWSELGATLKAIMAAECGGTVTVQKMVDRGSGLEPASGIWSYTTETGVRELDLTQSSSVTFDYPFPAGTASKTVQITEQAVGGWVLDRVSCTIGGVPVDPARIGLPADGAPGVSLSLQPNEAASCVFVSRPA